MTDFARDFENLMRKGFNVYVEGNEDDTIYLEAHDRADDSHIVKASYNADGARVSYNAEDFVTNIIRILNPARA